MAKKIEKYCMWKWTITKQKDSFGEVLHHLHLSLPIQTLLITKLVLENGNQNHCAVRRYQIDSSKPVAIRLSKFNFFAKVLVELSCVILW